MDTGTFCNLSTLGTLIINETSALTLFPQQVTLLDLPLYVGIWTVRSEQVLAGLFI